MSNVDLNMNQKGDRVIDVLYVPTDTVIYIAKTSLDVFSLR